MKTTTNSFLRVTGRCPHVDFPPYGTVFENFCLIFLLPFLGALGLFEASACSAPIRPDPGVDWPVAQAQLSPDERKLAAIGGEP